LAVGSKVDGLDFGMVPWVAFAKAARRS
jgi:hypothetical protein